MTDIQILSGSLVIGIIAGKVVKFLVRNLYTPYWSWEQLSVGERISIRMQQVEVSASWHDCHIWWWRKNRLTGRWETGNYIN